MSYKSLYFPRLRRRSSYSSSKKYKDYRQYRQEIREDCQGRCAYCDAHENEIGGVECMTLDHFKPQYTYEHLKNDPNNLVWTCSKCNGFKGNICPVCGTIHKSSCTISNSGGFIDPFVENKHDYFDILPDGRLEALKVPAHFMIDTLMLNRTGAKKIRENRNKRYERRQKFEEICISSAKRYDNLLKNPSLSKEEKKEIHEAKVQLEQEYEQMIGLLDSDFNLY